MSVQGIDRIIYGADDFETCRRFFLDWGLSLKVDTPSDLVFETLNGCQVVVKRTNDSALAPAIESGPTLREVVWGVETEADLAFVRKKIEAEPTFSRREDGTIGCIDPNGLSIRLQVSSKRDIDVEGAVFNSWHRKARIDSPSPAYERALPIEVGHVVFFVKDVKACEEFYTSKLGFVASDYYPRRAVFLRCAPSGGHHDLFMLQRPLGDSALNHVAFTVRDIHEVFGGGMHISRCGWETHLGPGRHPISSAYFWYFKNPAGALIEYYADEDELTEAWSPRNFEPGPTVFAEWAIDGGIDGHTRRQKHAFRPKDAFLTDRPSSTGGDAGLKE